MPIEPRHPLVEIKDAVSDFVSKEAELASAELKPAAKAAGMGAGFFAGAAVFLFHALWMLVILIALAVGLLLHSVTPMGPWVSFTLGFLASVLFSILVAGILFTLWPRQVLPGEEAGGHHQRGEGHAGRGRGRHRFTHEGQRRRHQAGQTPSSATRKRATCPDHWSEGAPTWQA